MLRLPPDITVDRRRTPGGAWAFVFRHAQWGEIGRIVPEERPSGGCLISCEVVGDPADPMTARRRALFEPLGRDANRQLEALTGVGERVAPPVRSPEPIGVVESKGIQCGAVVALLVFAPEATEPGRFEDYARGMYPRYSSLQVPTWIIGPALGSGPLMERPADVLKVWPQREPMQRLRPAQFNLLLDPLQVGHCRPVGPIQ